MKFGIGQPVRRVEDDRFLTGRGRYTDDIPLPGHAFGCVVRSPHAHARLLAVNAARARRAPGVLGVFTAADLEADGIGAIPDEPDPPGNPLRRGDGTAAVRPPYYPLVRERVRYVGDAVALVVAETLPAALDAAEHVAVSYDPLPPVMDLAAALEPAAPQVWDEAAGNLCFDYEAGDATAAAEAFARAHHVTSLDLVHNRIVINAMEARSALGTYDPETGRYTLFAGSQGANRLKLQLAHAVLHVAEDLVRVISPDVGGGFGLKSFLYQEFVLVLWAARRLRRAVRWTGERSECMASDLAGRDRASRATLALDADGNILALRVSTLANLGAYVSSLAPAIAAFGGNRIVTGVYRTPVLHNRVRGVFTNMTPVNAYRSAGRPEAIYVVERLID